MGRDMVRNKKGLVAIIALLLLLVLTLIGISAISTSTFETLISGNERVGTDAFYAAEAGIQMGLNQLPITNRIDRTPIGKDSWCWSVSPKEKNGPQDLESLGLYPPPIGTDPSIWECKRFRVNTRGSSFNAVKELEVQVRYGPFPAGTGYN
jgi:hypothetical protein